MNAICHGICPIILDDDMDEEYEKCQKLNLRVLLSISLIFCHFQSSDAYKSVNYKKSVKLKLKT